MSASGKKKETKRHIQAKTSFTSPFTPKWTPLPQQDMHVILKTLKDALVSARLQKKEVKVFRPWRKKKQPKPEPQPAVPPEPAATAEPAAQVSQVNGWTDVSLRRQLSIGINEVTKALERNELRLLLVCKSVKPTHMTDHLIPLSVTRGVPACQVPRLSEHVSEPLGLKSVLALGFKRCVSENGDAFTDAVDVITPRVPPLNVAWLQGAASSVTCEEEPVAMDTEDAKGQKRKLEETTESASSSCALQPLKAKKVVANPAKKRKTKRKS